jgi:hypothetical protein
MCIGLHTRYLSAVAPGEIIRKDKFFLGRNLGGKDEGREEGALDKKMA